jgi:hypothetical protein
VAVIATNYENEEEEEEEMREKTSFLGGKKGSDQPKIPTKRDSRCSRRTRKAEVPTGFKWIFFLFFFYYYSRNISAEGMKNSPSCGPPLPMLRC